MKLTRRELAGAAIGSVAGRALAQTQAAPPGTPDEELKGAQARLKSTVETLARQEIPMSTEPAFQFKA